MRIELQRGNPKNNMKQMIKFLPITLFAHLKLVTWLIRETSTIDGIVTEPICPTLTDAM
jgi:hypothetical protein